MRDDTRALGSTFADSAHRTPPPAELSELVNLTDMHAPGDDFFDDLSPRLVQTAGLVITGNCRKSIANVMNLSLNTVGSNLQIVFRKLGVHRSEEVAAQYFGPPDEVQFAEFVKDYHLAPSEAKTLRLALVGMSRDDIATSLNVSVNTITDRLKGVYNKIGIHRYDDLFVAVHSHGAFQTDYKGQCVPSFTPSSAP